MPWDVELLLVSGTWAYPAATMTPDQVLDINNNCAGFYGWQNNISCIKYHTVHWGMRKAHPTGIVAYCAYAPVAMVIFTEYSSVFLRLSEIGTSSGHFLIQTVECQVSHVMW